jgi:diphosphomevalonate decarboxylase
MHDQTATSTACANIALVKYWGDRDSRLRLPANGSISMNLDALQTRTRVVFDPNLNSDVFTLNGREMQGGSLERVSSFLDLVRAKAKETCFASVESRNTFPTGAGLASSAAAFAALSLAATRAIGLSLSEKELSCLARRGSGSACRSVPTGFVEWIPGEDDNSYGFSIAPPGYWDLVDCIAILQPGEKKTGSSEGHSLANTSPLQVCRVEDTPRRLDICRRALLERDFSSLAAVVEQDSTLMHSVMMTSTPSLFYWEPASLDLIKKVIDWRREGLLVCSTLDAGPNVHILCPAAALGEVKSRLQTISGIIDILVARPGGGVRLVK